MFRKVGRWSYTHRWQVVFAWLFVLISTNVVAAQMGPAFESAFQDIGSESDRGGAVLAEHFPELNSTLTGSIVVQAEQGVTTPEVQTAMEGLLTEVAKIEGVKIVSPYEEIGQQQLAPDGTIAFARVNLAPDIDPTEAGIIGEEIRDLIEPIEEAQPAIAIEVGGEPLTVFEPPETEFIGLAFAVIILILAFGSVLAMGLPIGVALVGVGTGAAITTMMTHITSIPDFAPLIGIMIGLGVGIDYALFIVTRYRKAMKEGLAPLDAVAIAMDTAGRAVVFAGLTVVASLLGLLLIGLSFASGLGISASATVAVTMVASVTLLPALLGFAQEKLEITRVRGLISAGLIALAMFGFGANILPLAAVAAPAGIIVLLLGLVFKPLQKLVPSRPEKPLRETLAYTWSRSIQARPWVFLFVGGGILLLLSAPLLSLRLGFSDEGNFPEDETARKAYDLVAEGFGPGANGLIITTISIDETKDAGPQLAKMAELQQVIEADAGIATVSPALPSNLEDVEASEAFLLSVIPTTSPQDQVTEETVQRLRQEVIPQAVDGSGLEVNLTGSVPIDIDFTSYMGERSLVFFSVVLIISFVLLMAVFRSLLVPLKAVIMNMLSISAAYGVVVALFQWGWFGSITGIEPAPIEPFVPMMLFAIVFGLSMDYEVFLLSRIKEEFDKTGDAANSVADGLASTARVITAAAAIMTVVFGSFLFEDLRVVKLFGVGLSMAVLLDASFVRMLLVPATMELLGKKNWWLPGWLDRRLPKINVEGSDV